MSLLRDEDLAAVRERLSSMANPVKLVHFTQELNLEYGREALDLLNDVARAADKISIEIYNFLRDKEEVAEYDVDKVPATVVRSEKDFGIRFYGLPAGYEFSTLLDDILNVSNSDSGLNPETRLKLAKINRPLHLEVFFTPACPYCSKMARLAHSMAMENDFIKADCIEATEFPELVDKYKVYAVPKTVLDGRAFIEGALPEDFFIDRILNSLGIEIEKSPSLRER